MLKEVKICIGCGKNTIAKHSICHRCLSRKRLCIYPKLEAEDDYSEESGLPDDKHQFEDENDYDIWGWQIWKFSELKNS